jgi:hypothetical protein
MAQMCPHVLKDLLELLDPEDEDIMILQNAENHLPNNKASHARRLDSF